MPTPSLLAVAIAARTSAAALSGLARGGSRASMTPAQAEACKARLAALLKKRRWRDALTSDQAMVIRLSLVDADLSGANLANADLAGLNFASVNLADADLAGADLCFANLTDSNLTNANLAGANLEGAHLPEGFLARGTRLDAVPWKGMPYGWKAIASPRGARFIPLPKA